ncbi:hypothetical protein EYR38_010078 [Pleurotus pulmonarius]|nr:hypothetical protein EYR38_010078 [Pleurotus pulmonarius]
MIVVPAPPMTIITRVADASTDDEPEDFPFPEPETTSRTTVASYHEDPLPGISKTPSAFLHHGASWKLTLPIPVPTDILKPTLASLRYMVKYGTKFDDGNSTVQTDVVLSSKNLPGGVSKIGGDVDEPADVYRAVKSGYAPRIVDDGSGTALVTVSAVKCNGGTEQWSHFVDGQELRPNIRLVEPTARLYFIFNVAEYPTKDTERFLAVEIAASWFEDEEARAEKDEADRLAAEEAERQAKREAERIAREEAEKAKRAEEELERKINLEVTRRVAEVESRLRVELQASSRSNAPDAADAAMQSKIESAVARYTGAACPNGFAWSKVEDGYRCNGGTGSHSLTWAQLGM